MNDIAHAVGLPRTGPRSASSVGVLDGLRRCSIRRVATKGLYCIANELSEHSAIKLGS